jgi:hypothetical protein
MIWWKVSANFVPAAAVIREGQALSGMIGRKVFVDGKYSYKLNLKFIFKIIYNTF